MSVQLLDKTRKINKLLHNNNSSKVVFNDICAVLTEILDSNVLVVSRKGKILGVSKSPDVQEISELITEAVGSHIDQMLNERLLSILSTKENVNLETLGFSAEAVQGCQAIVTPIDIAGVIESRSSGMKGTYIKVLNDYIFEELEKIKKERM